MIIVWAILQQPLNQSLESEFEVAIKWFHEHKMIVNPGKFQAIVLTKHKLNNTEVKFIIDSEQIPVGSSIDILGLRLDDNLTHM